MTSVHWGKEMMRLIDSDELIEVTHRIRLDSRERIEQMIESAPIVDAVEVIRCENCKFFEDEDEDGDCWCYCHNDITCRDGYCYWGERRKNEDK